MDVQGISWQERYHASGVFTLRCRIRDDQPGMLGKLTGAIGEAGAHIGSVNVAGVEVRHKLRDITVYCSDNEHLQQVLQSIENVDGIEVCHIQDDVMEIHRRGTIRTISTVPITNLSDLRMVYTPGVASICEKIKKDPGLAWEMTGLCDRVAIVTNGTAVLGLGHIGTLASLPVMEGKAAIFAEFAGISAFPILVDSLEVDEVVEDGVAYRGQFWCNTTGRYFGAELFLPSKNR